MTMHKRFLLAGLAALVSTPAWSGETALGANGYTDDTICVRRVGVSIKNTGKATSGCDNLQHGRVTIPLNFAPAYGGYTRQTFYAKVYGARSSSTFPCTVWAIGNDGLGAVLKVGTVQAATNWSLQTLTFGPVKFDPAQKITGATLECTMNAQSSIASFWVVTE